MPMRQCPKCNSHIDVPPEYGDRGVLCPKCRHAITSEDAPSSPSPSNRIYRVVRFQATKHVRHYGQSERQLEELLNDMAAQGWDYYRTDVISEIELPGCFASLFGIPSSRISYNLLIFIRHDI
jgi:hypothetical protein